MLRLEEKHPAKNQIPTDICWDISGFPEEPSQISAEIYFEVLFEVFFCGAGKLNEFELIMVQKVKRILCKSILNDVELIFVSVSKQTVDFIAMDETLWLKEMRQGEFEPASILNDGRTYLKKFRNCDYRHFQ